MSHYAKSHGSNTRRSFFGNIAAKTLAMTAAIAGFSQIATADPFCCDLVIDGGTCGNSGCQSECASFGGYYHCWPCTYQSFHLECCECITEDQDPGNCFGDDGSNFLCSCYNGGPFLPRT